MSGKDIHFGDKKSHKVVKIRLNTLSDIMIMIILDHYASGFRK